MFRTRERDLGNSSFSGYLYQSDGGGGSYNYSFPSWQRTEDSVHRWPPEKGFGGDIGGPFKSVTSAVQHSPAFASGAYAKVSGVHMSYTGPFLADANGALDVPVGGSVDTDSSLLSVGTTAIARSIPTAPAANVSVMLGELFREGVPRAIGAATLKNRFSDYRDIGGEYLNYQFGWAPIVSDLKSVARAISNSDRILRQLERDSGKNVRRRFAFPIDTNVDHQYVTGGFYDPVPYIFGVRQAARSKTTFFNFTKKRWFSGCFTFHFALSDKQRSGLAYQAEKARVLLGLELTPETVWNLTPWSWMADWVTNAGDVFTNMSRFANDDLAMRYGYVMSSVESVSSTTLHNFPVADSSGVYHPMSASVSRRYSSKRRMPATPYGFGLDTGGFTTRQWAILGALGISRGPNAR